MDEKMVGKKEEAGANQADADKESDFMEKLKKQKEKGKFKMMIKNMYLLQRSNRRSRFAFGYR